MYTIGYGDVYLIGMQRNNSSSCQKLIAGPAGAVRAEETTESGRSYNNTPGIESTYVISVICRFLQLWFWPAQEEHP